MFVLIFNNWGKKWQPSLFNYVQTSFLANCYFNIYFFFHGSGWGVVPIAPQTNESWMVEVITGTFQGHGAVLKKGGHLK